MSTNLAGQPERCPNRACKAPCWHGRADRVPARPCVLSQSTVGMSGAADVPASREQAELADDPRHIVKWFVDASHYHDPSEVLKQLHRLLRAFRSRAGSSHNEGSRQKVNVRHLLPCPPQPATCEL